MDHDPKQRLTASDPGLDSSRQTTPSPRPPSDIQPHLAGRARELAALRSRLDAARQGAGSVILLVGEPGIGKTQIARAFAAEARATGARVVSGRSYEAEWSPPYGPWIEALDNLLGPPGSEHRQSRLDRFGPGASPLVGQLLGHAADTEPGPVSPTLTPDEERYRLHEAVTSLLVEAATDQPIVLLLDDLQWADPASLALVRHVVRALPRAGIVLLATLRDAELDRAAHSTPLTELLATLHREPGFVRLPVVGLDREAVSTLLSALAARPVSPELSAAVHGETGGNPFYAGEVMRHLLDEDRLVARDGGWTADLSFRELGVPEGVRQVVTRRISRLSAPTQALLGLASVFSAGAQAQVLHALGDLAEPDLLDALDEALAAGLIIPVPGRDERYDFTHAIIRHALYESRSRARRARLHRQVAEALERVHGARAAEHAAEIAGQYHASAALPGAERGIPFAITAAEQARATFARTDAVAALRLARDLSAGADPATSADVLSRLAVAEADAIMLPESARTIDAAVAAFLESVTFTLKSNGADSAVWLPLVERGIALSAPAKDLTWARLHLILDPIDPVPDTPFKAGIWRGFDPEAVRIARELGGEEDHARTLESFDPRTRAETTALLALARRWTKPAAKMRALTVAANDLQYRHGAFAEAAAVWEELRALSERSGAISWQANSLHSQTFLHLATGDFDAARETTARANALLAGLGPYREPDVLAAEMATSLAWYLDGDWTALAAFWSNFVAGPAPRDHADFSLLAGPLYAAMATLASARIVDAGGQADAARLLDALSALLRSIVPAMGNQNPNGAVAFAAGAAWQIGAGHLAPLLESLAKELISLGVGDYPQTSLDLTIARMASLRNDSPHATSSFSRARATLDASGQRPLRAIVDFDEALSIVRAKTDLNHAIGLLEAAEASFSALHMTDWVTRAESLRGSIDAISARPHFPAGLTEREMDVLRLVGRGYSDRQISDALFISPRTVNAHLRNMFAKATVNNRTELSVWASAHGLLDPVSPDPNA